MRCLVETAHDDGKWRPSIGEPRSHYHLVCSEKGNHASIQSDSEQLKFYGDELAKLGVRLE